VDSMPNPFRVLSLPETATDEAVRSSYVALLKKHPPEREPERFREIQAAYETIRDELSRRRFLLFEPSRGETLQAWIQEIREESRHRRMSLDDIRSSLQTS
jgi:curved DNA-binding protein CbpA